MAECQDVVDLLFNLMSCNKSTKKIDAMEYVLYSAACISQNYAIVPVHIASVLPYVYSLPSVLRSRFRDCDLLQRLTTEIDTSAPH